MLRTNDNDLPVHECSIHRTQIIRILCSTQLIIPVFCKLFTAKPRRSVTVREYKIVDVRFILCPIQTSCFPEAEVSRYLIVKRFLCFCNRLSALFGRTVTRRFYCISLFTIYQVISGIRKRRKKYCCLENIKSSLYAFPMKVISTLAAHEKQRIYSCS